MSESKKDRTMIGTDTAAEIIGVSQAYIRRLFDKDTFTTAKKLRKTKRSEWMVEQWEIEEFAQKRRERQQEKK